MLIVPHITWRRGGKRGDRGQGRRRRRCRWRAVGKASVVGVVCAAHLAAVCRLGLQHTCPLFFKTRHCSPPRRQRGAARQRGRMQVCYGQHRQRSTAESEKAGRACRCVCKCVCNALPAWGSLLAGPHRWHSPTHCCKRRVAARVFGGKAGGPGQEQEKISSTAKSAAEPSGILSVLE